MYFAIFSLLDLILVVPFEFYISGFTDFALFYIISHYSTLFRIILRYFTLFYIISHYSTLFHITLRYFYVYLQVMLVRHT